MRKVIIHNTIEQDIIQKWEELWRNNIDANFSNSPFWFLSIIATFKYKDYKIIGIENNGKLEVITGLIKTNVYGIATYSLLPNDFICGIPFLIDFAQSETIELFISTLKKIGTVIINNVPSTFCKELLKYDNEITTVYLTANPILNFETDSKGEVIIPKKKRMLRESKKYQNHLQFKSFSGDDLEHFKTVFELDRKSPKFQNGYNAFSDISIQKFYKNLAKNFGEYFRINFLYFDETPIVYELGFLINETYYGSQIAHDQQFQYLAPGKVMETELIKYLFEQKVKKINYGSGDNFIKKTLANSYKDLDKLIITNDRKISLYLSLLFKSRDGLFQMINKNKMIYALYRKFKNLF